MTTNFPAEMIRSMKGHLEMGWQRDSLVSMFGPNAAHHMGLRVTRDLLMDAGYSYHENKSAANWEESDRIRDLVTLQLHEQATDSLIAAVGPVRVFTPAERQAIEEERYEHCESMAALAFEDAAYGRDRY